MEKIVWLKVGINSCQEVQNKGRKILMRKSRMTKVSYTQQWTFQTRKVHKLITNLWKKEIWE